MVEIDTERCKGCGLCVEACPEDLALSTAEFNKAAITRPFFWTRIDVFIAWLAPGSVGSGHHHK